jgi:DNA-binding NtrC family response regulator
MEVRKLLERMVRELGHEPILARVPAPDTFHGIDVYIVEIDAEGSLGQVLAQAASQREPSLPIVGIGDARPPAQELALLEIELAAWLTKPFTLAQLREAIERALAQSE